VPVDVQSIHCDFLTGTGRKYVRAPRGSGFLYARSASLHLLEPGVLDNVGATWTGRGEYELAPGAKRFESYEMSYASKMGLGVAVDMCLSLGIERIWERIQGLAALMRRRLEEEVPQIKVQDHGRVLCGLVSFSLLNTNSNSGGSSGLTEIQVQQELLKRYKINTSISKRPSTRIDFEARGLEEVVRASVHYYNTEEEINMFINALKSILN
jgi:selenocysteine lyase/cysteine desulfurase